MRVNPQMTDLCRTTSCLFIIVLDSHHNFIDGSFCVASMKMPVQLLRPRRPLRLILTLTKKTAEDAEGA
jgi:hypothetical protein